MARPFSSLPPSFPKGLLPCNSLITQPVRVSLPFSSISPLKNFQAWRKSKGLTHPFFSDVTTPPCTTSKWNCLKRSQTPSPLSSHEFVGPLAAVGRLASSAFSRQFVPFPLRAKMRRYTLSSFPLSVKGCSQQSPVLTLRYLPPHLLSTTLLLLYILADEFLKPAQASMSLIGFSPGLSVRSLMPFDAEFNS